MTQPTVIFRQGIPDEHLARAAELYEQAFGNKFRVVVPSQASRIEILHRGLNPVHAIAALEDGQLVGLAGYHTPRGSLTGGITWRVLLKVLGAVRGSLAAMLFALFIRKPGPGELLMDGIAVAPQLRGQGIGTGLLDAVTQVSRELGLEAVRLEVIDTNPRAKQLYLKNGFKVVRTRKFEFLRQLLGFGAADTMVRPTGVYGPRSRQLA